MPTSEMFHVPQDNRHHHRHHQVRSEPACDFSLEALNKIVGDALARQRDEFLQAMAAQQAKDKPARTSMAGKSEQAIKNEIATVRAFKRAGFGNVKPHEDVLTFNKWAAKGFRPKEGSKSVKVATSVRFGS
jgi:hypothetical protein